MNKKKLYDFGSFRLDEEQKCLWRDQELVSLTPKAYETLLVLIKNKGRVLTKNTLLDEVWADTFVEEATLAQNISTLRKTLALHDQGVEFIATIPRRGYRFVADVTEITAEEEELVVEKHSVTHIVAEQREIHDSLESGNRAAASDARPASGKKASVSAVAGLILVSLIVVAAGFALYGFFSGAKNFYTSKFNKFRLNTLYSSADLSSAIVSPDGKYLAITERRGDFDSIYLKQVEDGNLIEVLPKSSLLISGITFSHQSDQIYYTAYPRLKAPGTRIGKLYKIPILGGAPLEILSDIDSPVAVSPDGKKLAFVRNKLKDKRSLIVVSNADGSGSKDLVDRELANGFSTYGLSWSPDGKLISSVVFERTGKKPAAGIALIDAATGEQKPLGENRWLWVGRTTWLKDSSGVALVAYGATSPNVTDEVWFVSYPEGKARLISNGLKGIVGISVTDDVDSIVATRSNRVTKTITAPLEDLENTVEIAKTADGEGLLALGTEWAPDGGILYGKIQNGNADIWKMNSDGTQDRQLTSDKSADYGAASTRDGKQIFFTSTRGGAIDIWRIDANGENPRQITNIGNVSSSSVSPDGLIYFTARSASKPYGVLWQVDFEGKDARQVTKFRTYGSQVSPDGEYILCFYPDKGADPEDITIPLKYTLLSVKTGEVIRQFASLKNRELPLFGWSADSKSFLFIDSESAPTLWKQDIDGQDPAKLREWKTGNIYQFAVSPDGKNIAFEIGDEVNSVVQLKNITPE